MFTGTLEGDAASAFEGELFSVFFNQSTKAVLPYYVLGDASAVLAQDGYFN